MIIAVLSFLAVSTAAVTYKDSDPLLLVQTVIRHADRAATHGFATPESPTILFRGNEELTDDGIDNAYKQGQDFKKRYVKTGFIDKRYLPSEVYFRSSAVSRCLMSAASFAAALFKTTDNDRNIVPPIFTVDPDTDSLLVPLLTCTDGWDDVLTKYNLTASNNTMNNAMYGMIANGEWPASCSTVNPGLVDAIVSELPNKKINLPKDYKKCAKDGGKRFMYSFLDLLGGGGHSYNELRMKRTIGILTNELLNNMAAAASCSTASCGPKFRVYYTHDLNVLTLSHVFNATDLYQGITPSFSSALVFELRQGSNGPYVKVFLKDGQKADFIDSGLCDGDCSFAAVQQAAQQFAISEPIICAP